ncbi:MAG: hypothetical protein QOG73_3931 [Acetobacteraceae bacterium]|jgi:hypothetical protein|nr:hypothetical protein [Acetobacteraceae bacterium]
MRSVIFVSMAALSLATVATCPAQGRSGHAAGGHMAFHRVLGGANGCAVHRNSPKCTKQADRQAQLERQPDAPSQRN